MSTAFQVAELLEEIANNADPVSIVKRGLQRLVLNAKIPTVAYMINTNPAEKTATITYMIPVDVAMKGVEGSPEEVIEWLNTGSGNDVSVSIMDVNGPQFAVSQVLRNEHVIADLDELWDKYLGRMRRKHFAGDAGPTGAV